MNAFHVLGGLLAIWALVVAGLGIVSHSFPGGGTGEKIVIAISVLLVGSVVAAAVITSAEEKKEKDAEAAEERAEAEGEEAAAEGEAAEAGAESVEVTMEGIKYVPEDVRVAVGGMVKWVNTDTPTHTVTKVDGPGEEFDSGEMEPGAGFEQSFPEAGTVNYVCDIHPLQKGTVTVE